MESKEKVLQVQGLMVFLGALANGLELLLGRGAEGICFRSGKTMGLEWKAAGKERDASKALDAVRREMHSMGINWPFEVWKKQRRMEGADPSDDPETIHEVNPGEGMHEVDLVFRNCLARCTLFRYGFPQEMSLCQTKHGLFCGLFENISGTKATLDIVHSGENACLLKLKYYV